MILGRLRRSGTALPMSAWANYSSPSSDSPDSDLPRHIRMMRGGGSAGVGDSDRKPVLFCGFERPDPHSPIR